jgi:hypothetical protein
MMPVATLIKLVPFVKYPRTDSNTGLEIQGRIGKTVGEKGDSQLEQRNCTENDPCFRSRFNSPFPVSESHPGTFLPLRWQHPYQGK